MKLWHFFLLYIFCLTDLNFCWDEKRDILLKPENGKDRCCFNRAKVLAHMPLLPLAYAGCYHFSAILLRAIRPTLFGYYVFELLKGKELLTNVNLKRKLRKAQTLTK